MALLVAILISWWVIIPLILIIMALEHYEQHGWSVILTLVLAVLLCANLELSALVICIIAVAYLPVGIGCSVWRWKRHCSDIVEKVRNDIIQKSDGRKQLSFTNRDNISLIMGWVVSWPFAMAESFVGDLIDVIRLAVTNWFRSVYERISQAAIKELDDIK